EPVVLAGIDEPQPVGKVVRLPVVVGGVAVEREAAPLPDVVPDPVEEARDRDEREADMKAPDPRPHRGHDRAPRRCRIRSRIPHQVTRTMASTTMRLDIFDVPRSRSVKVIGTSTTRPPARTSRYVISI